MTQLPWQWGFKLGPFQACTTPDVNAETACGRGLGGQPSGRFPIRPGVPSNFTSKSNDVRQAAITFIEIMLQLGDTKCHPISQGLG